MPRALSWLLPALSLLGLCAGLCMFSRTDDVDALSISTASVGANTFNTDTLNAPSGLSATGGASIVLSWTATTSTYASGYHIYRSTTSGSYGASLATVTPRTTVTYTDNPSAGTYYYVVRAFYQNWESVNSNEASATPVLSVTGADAWTTGLTHTVGSGNNRLLLFVVGMQNASDSPVSAVTYGGQSLTQIVATVTGGSAHDRVELWYLKEAGIAAASGNTFSVTWGGVTPSYRMYAAATFQGVNQTTPIYNSSSNSTNSSGNPIATAVNVVNRAMAVSGAIDGDPGSYTWNNGWTKDTDQTVSSQTTMSSAEHAEAATGTDTASATSSSPNRQAIVAATLNPN